jgi:hypothetical protein
MFCHVFVEKELSLERIPTNVAWEWFVLDEDIVMSLSLLHK